MVRQLRGAGVRRDLARDLTRASSPLLVAPLGGVGPSESDGTGPPPKGVVCGGAVSGRGTCWRGRGGYRGRSSGRGLAASALLHALIHRIAWRDCPKRCLSDAPGAYFAARRKAKRLEKRPFDGPWDYATCAHEAFRTVSEG